MRGKALVETRGPFSLTWNRLPPETAVTFPLRGNYDCSGMISRVLSQTAASP